MRNYKVQSNDISGGVTGGGGLGGLVHPNSQSRQKLSMKNGIKLVGYTFRLKNYVKIPPPPIPLRFFRAGAATEYFIFHIFHILNIFIQGTNSIRILFYNLALLKLKYLINYLQIN